MSSVHTMLHYPNRYYRLSSKKIARTNWVVRLAGLVLLGTVAWNLAWVLTSLNLSSVFYIILSVLFLAATCMVVLYNLIHVINNWHFKTIEPKLFEGRVMPRVAVLLPTYGESVTIVRNTVKSIVQQEWSHRRMIVVVSDDGHSDDLRAAIEDMIRSGAPLYYMRPPKKGDTDRRGDAKAGNLNAALAYIAANYPDIQYIETRDADDLVANRHFISHCVEYLESHPEASFVQTIKKCRVSDGDPFSNQESMFYQRSMPARFAANAVFPCGSGLVWRLRDLQKIGGFPSWNLVEDLQSGYEILRVGGQGVFMPIVGAMGQIAPEDIPNFYKQRGTWALDTLRLLYYRNPLLTKGLSIRQKLHFFEMQFAYVLSFAMAIFIFEIMLGLTTGISPVVSSGSSFLTHLLLLAVVLESHAVARARGISYGDQWHTRQIWMGLMPVFILSAIRALLYGPHKKPSYKVTRKYHKVGIYWRETAVQSLVVVALSAAVVYSLVFPRGDVLYALGLQFWALYFIYGFSRVVRNSWHNYKLKLNLVPLPRAKATK